MDRKWAVVTGASSGIGVKFAEKLAAKGYNLVIAARRAERLGKICRKIRTRYKCECEPVTVDLSTLEGCLHLYEMIEELDVEVFINNAGFGECGRFTETDMDRELEMIDVNIKAVHILTKLMVKKFCSVNRGYLLNVGSSAGMFPGGPFMAAYYASKAYVNSLTRAVAEELERRGSSVYVGCLCPGPVDTEFNSVANVEFSLKGISADRCAGYALRKMFRRETVIVPGVTIKAAVLGARLLPQRLIINLTGNQQRRKMANSNRNMHKNVL